MQVSIFNARFLLGLALVLGLTACDMSAEKPTFWPFGEAKKEPPPAAVPASPPPARRAPVKVTGLPDFTQLVAEEGPAVVNISTTQHVRAANPLGLADDDPMNEFFRRFMPDMQPRERDTQSLGSGFIISDDGYILTNAHVVADADSVTVRLTDKREFKAKVVGYDRRTDVAVLKIAAEKLPRVQIGQPKDLRPGEWVVAIGSPFGFDNSVTAGVVSATGRALPDETLVPFIQTDVAINPGNSGGPLFNMSGEVVGINSQIYSRTGGYMGVSFAIPMDVAMSVYEQLRQNGKISRGRLGVQIQDLNPELAKSFGLSVSQGALVVRVDAQGPAAEAGIQAGDVIVSFNGSPIQNSKDLPMLVANSKPGAEVKLEVLREGKTLNLKTTLVEMKGEGPNTPAKRAQESNRYGMRLLELSPEQKKELGVEQGVWVDEVEGLAAKAGLKSGDVILAVNNARVLTPSQCTQLLDQAKTSTVALLILREGNALYLPFARRAQ